MAFQYAKWITAPMCGEDQSPEFQKVFLLDAAPLHAELSISGLGFYEAKLNGKPVSDALLQPAFSRYDVTTYYNVYDVAPLLRAGENVLEVGLGNGWFYQTQADVWEFQHANWRAHPQLIAELSAEGSVCLASGTDWQCRGSQTVFNSLRCGETMDASREPEAWGKAVLGREPGGVLREQTLEPIRLRERLEGKYLGGGIWDFGKNLTGCVEIAVRGAKGTRVQIQYSELCHQSGALYPETNDMYVEGGRFQKDEYILAGQGEETWHSRFGYNGFRYASIAGDCEILRVTGLCFHTDFAAAGGVRTEQPLLQALQDAIVRSTLTNFHHIPTDCPHREKNGWTGDAHLSCEQALWNLDISAGYSKFLDDVLDCARPNGAIPCIAPTSSWGYSFGTGPCWDVILFNQPWQMYLFSGDRAYLEKYYPAMRRYLAYLDRTSENFVYRFGLGDWCPPAEAPSVPTDMMNTAVWYRCLEFAGKAARVLGETEDEKRYAETAEKVREAFRKEFIGKVPEGITYFATLLDFGLTDEPDADFQRLLVKIEEAGWHMECGIMGVKSLVKTCVRFGRVDVLVKMLLTEGYPSYENMLKMGSGTLTERWDGVYSRNHHMYSSIGELFYTGIAGIRLCEEAPGFRRVTIQPYALGAAFEVWHRTPEGELRVSLDGKGGVKITVPAGTEAELLLPGRKSELLTEGMYIR